MAVVRHDNQPLTPTLSPLAGRGRRIRSPHDPRRALWREGGRVRPESRRTLLRPDPHLHGRRGDQGREARRRRRAQMGAAVHRRRGRELRRPQSRQEVDHRRSQRCGAEAEADRADRHGRRLRAQSARRRDREVRHRRQDDDREVSRARLRRSQRLRPYGPMEVAPGLRATDPGRGRAGQRQRRSVRPGLAHRRVDHRSQHRHVDGDRHPRRAAAKATPARAAWSAPRCSRAG